MAFILLVEDDDATAGMVRDLLVGKGHEVLALSDGRSALEHLESGQLPDLILTDIMMPGMDGEHLISRLQAEERTRSVPVVVLTAKGGVRPFLPETSAFLEKPFKVDALIAAVDAALRA